LVSHGFQRLNGNQVFNLEKNNSLE